jgi:hypothetical protein
MMRVPVTSSCLASIGYLAEAETLEIEFRSGAVYEYLYVPLEIHRGLLAAESKGAFLNRFIKTRYTTKQINFRSDFD